MVIVPLAAEPAPDEAASFSSIKLAPRSAVVMRLTGEAPGGGRIVGFEMENPAGGSDILDYGYL